MSDTGSHAVDGGDECPSLAGRISRASFCAERGLLRWLAEPGTMASWRLVMTTASLPTRGRASVHSTVTKALGRAAGGEAEGREAQFLLEAASS